MYQHKLNDFIKSYKTPIVLTLTFINLFILDLHPPDHLQLLNLYIRFPFQMQIVIFIFVEYQDYGSFCRISRLWNALPKIDTNLPLETIKNRLANPIFLEPLLGHF